MPFTSNEAQSKWGKVFPATRFRIFPEIPPEIRLKIWSFANYRARLIIRKAKITIGGRKTNAPPRPSTLLVNTESRYEAKIAYSKSFSHHLVYPIDFNSFSDTLIISDYDNLRCFSRSFYISSPWIELNTDQGIKVRSLAVAYYLHPGLVVFSELGMEFHNWRIKDLVLGIEHFAAVKEVFVVFGEDLQYSSEEEIPEEGLEGTQKAFQTCYSSIVRNPWAAM